MQRKLTVIFSADVVGYSGLMELDEAGTVDRLNSNRKSVFDPSVARHGERIVKLMGDGVLVEFASVVAAVNCAHEIQQASGAESHLAEAERIRYRIGINLGGVIVEGDDLYGDGVNVAARLQALADPGGMRGRAPCAINSSARCRPNSRTSASTSSTTRRGPSAS